MKVDDKEINDTRREIEVLLDCFANRIFPLFVDQFDYYKLLTVKLYRLELKKEIDNSSVDAGASIRYKIVDGYKL